MMKSIEAIMSDIFSNPTAPFREGWVLKTVENHLDAMDVPYFRDAFGNLIAGAARPSQLKSPGKMALVAHTDHPGFHLIKKLKPGHWQARWFGGAPPKVQGAAVAISNPLNPGVLVKGTIASNSVHPKNSKYFLIKVSEKVPGAEKLNKTCFGAFDFPGFRLKGHRVMTRAADDLTGVTIILGTFARLTPRERKNMIGVFTRAEEIGFRGAIGLIEKKTLGSAPMVISLEASRQMDGARLGLGPIIRLGDKRTLFDTGITTRLDEAAKTLKKKKKDFVVQRRIMNGGTCEATVFNLNGIRASGVAIPLGNYHNQRPDGRPGAEFIDLRDVHRAVELCVQVFRDLARNEDPIGKYLKQVHGEFKEEIGLLRDKISYIDRQP